MTVDESNVPDMATPTSEPDPRREQSRVQFGDRAVLPVFPPNTESATPAPLGRAMNTPTQRRLMSPRDLISDVGKLDELPHFVSKTVVHNLRE